MQDGARGTVAFVMGGAAEKGLSDQEGQGDETIVAHFTWAGLRFPQERGLVQFGTKVNMMVRQAARYLPAYNNNYGQFTLAWRTLHPSLVVSGVPLVIGQSCRHFAVMRVALT